MVTFNIPVQQQQGTTTLLAINNGLDADLSDLVRFRSINIDSQAAYLSYFLSQTNEALDLEVLTPCGFNKCMNPKYTYQLQETVEEGMAVYSSQATPTNYVQLRINSCVNLGQVPPCYSQNQIKAAFAASQIAFQYKSIDDAGQPFWQEYATFPGLG
jgi:hypothetical protein